MEGRELPAPPCTSLQYLGAALVQVRSQQVHQARGLTSANRAQSERLLSGWYMRLQDSREDLNEWVSYRKMRREIKQKA